MLSENMKNLRKKNGWTQEDIAEKLNVSRQAVAKWEKGESIPDIYSILRLSDLYQITVDELVRFLLDQKMDEKAEEGKYIFGTVKVGDKGQIVIPKKARDIFKIKVGDYLIILGDINRGMALAKTEIFESISEELLGKEEK